MPPGSRGVASLDSKSGTTGKAVPTRSGFRNVLRQSRENNSFDNAILNSREI
jgi:hypothetical protein